MKTKFSLLIVFLFAVTTMRSQVYRFIPDPAFRTYLSTIGCTFSSGGDSLDISTPAVRLATGMYCSHAGISSISGVEYFTSLQHLYCDNNSIDSISMLPSGLDTFMCNDNRLTSLPVLPSTLVCLNTSNNSIGSLPSIPSSLLYLSAINCGLTSLPALPSSLVVLDFSYNSVAVDPSPFPASLNVLYMINNPTGNIASLPATLSIWNAATCAMDTIPTIPSTLNELNIQGNNLVNLPDLTASNITSLTIGGNPIHNFGGRLPANLIFLQCDYMPIDSLPILPANLYQLNCDGDNLSFLPALPPSLVSIQCNHNNLSSLPTLNPGTLAVFCEANNLLSLPDFPAGMYLIDCSYNPSLSCLPYCPSSMQTIMFAGTAISCLPNIVITAAYTPITSGFPICTPGGSCPSFVSVGGTLYQDNNSNCIMDAGEQHISNVTVTMNIVGGSTSVSTTNADGFFTSDTLSTGLFVTHIDTLDMPYMVTCPASGYDTVNIGLLVSADMNRNFGLSCKSGYDLATTGLITNDLCRPASTVNFQMNAGDMAQRFGGSCSAIAGSIVLDYSGPATYLGDSLGSIAPDSVLPNHLVWNVADFSAHDYWHSLKPIFHVDSTALAGDLLCFTTTVSPDAADRIPSNNIFSQCITVVTSYDPNVKEVSPAGSVTASQGWLYYTIHFQNTGSSYAENIYVWDTIDPNLNLSTIQVVNASAKQTMQVFSAGRAVKFNFLNIHLLDSTTNERASHGYVQYRIKLNNALAEGVNIHNKASILFDLNAPVLTNTTSSKICNAPSHVEQHFNLSEGAVAHVGTHTYSKAGTYTDILTNARGCDSIVISVVKISSGIQAIYSNAFTIYPNPANDMVSIHAANASNEMLLVYDVFGNKVIEQSMNGNSMQLNTSSLASGAYIVQIANYHQRLIIQH
jgi:uncharacterized repeat protein (TIGR01451 family)